MSQINDQTFIQDHQWLIFQEQENPRKDQRDVALAYQDAFLRYILDYNDRHPEGCPHAILHFYPIFTPTVYLGAKDKLLKNFPAAVDYLNQAGHTVSLRPHGGLAVVEDEGIINLGIATDSRHIDLSIDAAYQLFIDIVQRTLTDYDLKVDAYEIIDSYCPGKYDIVVAGKKIGGIAQRRYKEAVTTAAYIGLNGDQLQRGQMIKQFYQIGEFDDRYPRINPHSMTTLSDLTGQDITVAHYQDQVIQTFQQLSQVRLGDYQDPVLEAFYQPLYEKAYQKSQKIQVNEVNA